MLDHIPLANINPQKPEADYPFRPYGRQVVTFTNKILFQCSTPRESKDLSDALNAAYEMWYGAWEESVREPVIRRGKMLKIKLSLRDAPLKIEPRLVNPAGTLAIHRAIRNGQESNLRIWTISHIPTGLEIIEINADLKSATKAFNCLDTADWNFGKFGQSTLSAREQPPSIKRALCLCWESIYAEPHPVLGASTSYDIDINVGGDRKEVADTLLDLVLDDC